MMKTVLLLVACLAFASASDSDCKDISTSVCAAVNTTCYATSSTSGGVTTTTNRICPSGTIASPGYGSSDCICTDFTGYIGNKCNSATQKSQNRYTCMAKQSWLQDGDTQLYWRSDKVEGDTCTNNFDCFGELQCLSSKCSARLQNGETCYNQTSSPTVNLQSSCPLKSYCNLNTGVCTARLAEGADCSDVYTRGACPTYQMCLEPDGYSQLGNYRTCQTPKWFVYPGGSWVNATSQCATGTWTNSTDKTCLSYANQMSIYNYAAGAADTCTTSYSPIGCSRFGLCLCTAEESTSATACSFSYSTEATLQSNYATLKAKAKLFYDNGCSFYSFPGSYPSATSDYTDPATWVSTLYSSQAANNQAYCSVRLGYYSSTSTVCGAFHNMGMSSITIVLSAIIATLLAKW